MEQILPGINIEEMSSELGIYERKQESKKTKKQEQESNQEKKGFFFLVEFLFSWSSSCFLTYFFSFINSHRIVVCTVIDTLDSLSNIKY